MNKNLLTIIKKIFVASFTVGLILNLSACSEAPEGSQYFPLQKGLEWTYEVTTVYPDSSQKEELKIETLGKQTFGDRSYYVRRTDSGIDYYHNHDETGTYREGLRTLVEFKPRLDRSPRFVLKLPLEVGTEWSEITQPMLFIRVHPYRQKVGKGSKVPLSYRIESVTDTVTVAAGTFENCIKVVAEGKIEVYTNPVHGYSDIPFTIHEWYAPNVGLVKQVREELYDDKVSVLDTPVFIGGKSTLELVKFSD